ncbi:MAG TPA: CAP-associated domain-containing protein, partial [Sporolactobacillaceae bacterium]|nr:CAP-associated domain-containing protein [Sporolactobacillaceae bacterium]
MLQKINLSILLLAIGVFLVTFYLKGHPSGQLKADGFKQSHSETASAFKPPKSGVASYLGLTSDGVIQKLGKPERKEPSSFGYEWWIYGVNTENYLQIGISKGKVVTIFALGDKLNTT